MKKNFSMLQWLADLVRHDFCADPEAEEVPKKTFLTMAAAKADEVTKSQSLVMHKVKEEVVLISFTIFLNIILPF